MLKTALKALCTIVCLSSIPAFAQQSSCETNFIVNRNGTSADFTAIDSPLAGSRTSDIAQQIKQAVQQSNFRIDSEEATESGTEITFLPNKQSRDAWLAMTASISKAGDIVSLRSLGDSSLKQQSTPQMRTFMCGFLANLPSVQSNKTQLANANPENKSKVRDITPRSELDVSAAQAALEPGSATIMGKACTTNDAGGLRFRDYLRNETIFLYPLTPYLKEALSLYEHAGKNEHVVVSPLIQTMRREVLSNNDGEFIFKNLKPGKYMVFAEHASAGRGTYDQYEGSDTQQTGVNEMTTTSYYSKQEFFANWDDILRDKVTISRPDEVIKISLTPPFRLQGVARVFSGRQKGTSVFGLSCSEWQLQ